MNLIHFIAVFCLSGTRSLPIQPLQNKWSENHSNQHSLNDNSTHFNPLGISELSSESYTNCGSHEQAQAADIIKANSNFDEDKVYRSSEIVETRLPVSDIQEQTAENETTENESTEEYTTEKVITAKNSSGENHFIHFLEYLSFVFNKNDIHDTGLSSLEVTNDLDTENIYRAEDHSSEDSDSSRQNDTEYGSLETSKAENSGETAETGDISYKTDHYYVAESRNKKIIVPLETNPFGNCDKSEEKSEGLNSASSQVDKDDEEEETESDGNVEDSKEVEEQQRFEEDNLEHSNENQELNSHHNLDNSENIKNDFEIDSSVTSTENNSNELTESRDNSEQNDDPTENEEPVDSSIKEETPKNSGEDDYTGIEENLNSQHSAEKSDEVTMSDYEIMIKENCEESVDMAEISNTNYTMEEKVQYDLENNTKNEESYLNDNDVSQTDDLSKQEESSRPEDDNTATEHTGTTEELNSYYTSEYPEETTDLEINIIISESSNQSTNLYENSDNESEQENSYDDLNEKNSHEVSTEGDHYDTAASSNVVIVQKGEDEHKSASSQEANTNGDSLEEEQTQHVSKEGYNLYGIASHEKDNTQDGEEQNNYSNTQDKNSEDEENREKNGRVLNFSISESEDGYCPYGKVCNDNDTTKDQSTLAAGSEDENTGYEDETRRSKENVEISKEEKTQHESEEGYNTYAISSTSIETTDEKDDQQNPSSQDENKDSKEEKIYSKENIDSLEEKEPQRSEEENTITHSSEKVDELDINHFVNSEETRDAFEIHSLISSREMNFDSSVYKNQNDDPKSSTEKETETPLDSSKEEHVSENPVEQNDSTDDTEGTQHRFEEETSNKDYNSNSENNNAITSDEPTDEGTTQKTQVHDSTDHIDTEESNSNQYDGESHEKIYIHNSNLIVSKDSNHEETVESTGILNVASILNTNENNSEDPHSQQEMSMDVFKEDNREKDYSHAASDNELVTELYLTENKEIISDDTDSYQTTQILSISEEIEKSHPTEWTSEENTDENKEGTSNEYTKQDFNGNEYLTEDETDETESSGSFSFTIPTQNYFSFILPDRRR